MIKNYRLLYDIKKIKDSFKDLGSLDVYDYRTMEGYVEENMSSFNLEELQIIKETISEEKEHLKMIQGFFITFITALLTVIAFGITAIVTLLSAITTLDGSAGNITLLGITAYLMGGLVIIYVFLLTFYYFKRSNDYKNIVKLQEAIKTIIVIKKSKEEDRSEGV
ncbi:hypothetical protein [Lysinibacillus fusiformis]|uniref:hypothetical protein n=1 Tax=Lysinibacillus fusiformis TaxID=28031 RepID=UPI0004693164|nr:hypothetical protein [Lysinibacillus fusiformis]